MRAFFATLLLLLLGGFRVQAEAPDRLLIRQWIELEPMVRIEPGQYPIPLEVAQKSLLEKGRVLFSGMVYGWAFSYTPGDRARGVRESFEVTPVAEVPWGSPRLRVIETDVVETRLWARISYALDEEESRKRASWDSNTAALATGRGTADVQRGPEAWARALHEAMRDAIRRSLDTRYVNKPREITGEVVLWADPVTVVASGTYTTTATVKILVRDLIPYRIF